jgi:hypothetical protein
MDRPEFHRLAERELNDAAQYYDGEEPGLGSSFLQEVDRCLLYKIKPSGMRILAVMNLKRRPTYWVGRE